MIVVFILIDKSLYLFNKRFLTSTFYYRFFDKTIFFQSGFDSDLFFKYVHKFKFNNNFPFATPTPTFPSNEFEIKFNKIIFAVIRKKQIWFVFPRIL